MKRIGWQWLAASSLLFAAMAFAESRPQYGGTLHVEMRAAPMTLDPSGGGVQDSFGRRSITSLLFDTLVMMDDAGRAKAGLAETWQSSRGNQRWEFRLRQGVKFEDGTPLTAETAAASLRAANPSWNVSVSGNSIIVEQEVPDPELPAELALSRNAIAKKEGDRVVGTGPFHVVEWQPGKRLTVAANEEYWRGRPFLDGIEIEMGRSFRDQTTAFELHKADLVEVAPEQAHRFSQEGRGLTTSARIELLALVFSRDASSAQEKLLRQALALSVERASIRSVLLQGAGEPTASLLPTWISGYAFVFPTETDLQRARQLRAEVRVVPSWTIGYDPNDPLSRLVAERIALNAKDAGLALQPTSGAPADVRALWIPLASGDPWVAMNEVLEQVGSSSPKKGGSIEELYTLEQAALASERVIPLFHLPASYASAGNLKGWNLQIDGSFDVTGAWLEGSKP